MIATIAVIAAIAEFSDHMETTPAIAATTIAEIELFKSQRSLSLRMLRSLKSGFHMIAIKK